MLSILRLPMANDEISPPQRYTYRYQFTMTYTYSNSYCLKQPTGSDGLVTPLASESLPLPGRQPMLRSHRWASRSQNWGHIDRYP